MWFSALWILNGKQNKNKQLLRATLAEKKQLFVIVFPWRFQNVQNQCLSCVANIGFKFMKRNTFTDDQYKSEAVYTGHCFNNHCKISNCSWGCNSWPAHPIITIWNLESKNLNTYSKTISKIQITKQLYYIIFRTG